FGWRRGALTSTLASPYARWLVTTLKSEVEVETWFSKVALTGVSMSRTLLRRRRLDDRTLHYSLRSSLIERERSSGQLPGGHQSHRRRRRGHERGQPNGRRRPHRRGVHRCEHGRAGAPDERRGREDPHRRPGDSRPLRG